MSALLELEQVSFAHQTHVVFNEVSFSAREGEFIALMGCNGAGKSTLLDTMAGLKQPGSGQILLKGKPLAAWPHNQLARQISHLPQSIRADLPFSSEQLVLMGRYPHGETWLDSPADRERARAAMQRTSCWQERSRRLFTLSGGERQRVLLAACLAQEGIVCLFDEPSVFLDIDHQLRCFDLLREETERGKLCIAVTHDINLALAYCSRLLILSQHRLALDISTEEARTFTGWLELFSTRLQLGRTPDGKPWVWYR